jgi:hypothetical protein
MSHASLMELIPVLLIALFFIGAAPIVMWVAERPEKHAH